MEHFVRSIGESGYTSPYDDNTNLLNSLINDLYKLEKQGEQNPTSNTRYEVKADGSLSVKGKPFDYEKATITQKDFACDVEEASYTAEVATGDGSIKSVVSKKVLFPNLQSKEWSGEDSSKEQRICKYLNEAKKYYADITEVRECMDWLKSLKDRIGG